MKAGWVYILRCADESYYVGCTSNVEHRIAQHHAGAIPGYTRSRRPVVFLWSEEFPDIRDAIRAERRIKGWTREKKEALMRGDFQILRELARNKNGVDTRRKGLIALDPHIDLSKHLEPRQGHPSTGSG